MNRQRVIDDEGRGPTTPDLSVILPTDTIETVERVLEALRRQTMASRLEVILVTPSVDAVAEAVGHESAFAALRVVGIETLAPLGPARASGVRAAAAPLVFIGETHSYLRPDAAERLVAAAADAQWDVIVPGFESANPSGVLSWSAFLGDYARWSAILPGGEIPEAPLYDCLCRRAALLDLGERLAPMLSFGDDLRRSLQAGRRRVLFVPEARLEHLNIASPWAWWHEHFLIGVLIGQRRARQWPWAKRLVYLAGAGLIPAVLFWRAWPSARRVARARRLPWGTFPALAMLHVAKALGEVFGYLGGGSREHEEAMSLYEIRRVDYVSRAA